MGYSHYWYRAPELNEKRFNLFVADVKKLYEKAKELNIPLANYGGEKGTKPIAKNDVIGFNGVGDNAHETMAISRIMEKRPYESGDAKLIFDFCKTARKPYDVIVTAVLVAFKHHFPKSELSSDGGIEGFVDGRVLCNEVFDKNYDLNFKLREED